MRCERPPHRLLQIKNEQGKTALLGDPTVELTQSSRRAVAWISKSL